MSGAVLGVSADYHDAAAAVVVDGEIVVAAQEERFSRRKHDPMLPVHAIEWCLDEAQLGPSDLAGVAFHGKPLTTYERIIRSHARSGPRGFRAMASAVGAWTGRKLWVGYRLERCLQDLGFRPPPSSFVEHHLAHGASAFHASPFERAAVVTADGVGEWATTTMAHGTSAGLELLAEVHYPNSLGLLYSTVTAFCGLAVNDGEAKLMGLAPYGRPRYERAIRDNLIHLRPDGSYRLDLRWFDFEAGEQMAHPRLAELFDGPPLAFGAPLTQREADLACSIQVVLDDAMLAILSAAHERTGERFACLAGGVALNCVTNGRLLDRGPFESIWVQPAAGDAGGSIGAALWLENVLGGSAGRAPGNGDRMRGSGLGRSFADDQIVSWLTDSGIAHVVFDDLEALVERVAADLDQGQIIGWFQGRSEFGPRALGNRSILADPRDPRSVTRINGSIKRREGFRPLAPAVLADRVGDLFVRGQASPYMLFTDQVRGAQPLLDIDLDHGPSAAELLASVPSSIPACTHVDGSARVQTVDAEHYPRFDRLLRAFDSLTGCPALVNTSFNIAGEPLVDTPADAVRCASAAGLDGLVLGLAHISGAELTRIEQHRAASHSVSTPG